MTEQEKALQQSDAIEHATLTRLSEIYAGALRTALKNKKAFLQKMEDVDSGKIKPPQYYVDRDEVDKWRQGFVKQLIRQNGIIDEIVEQLNAAGVQAADLIRGEMVQVYQTNRNAAANDISVATQGLQAVTPSFSVLNKKQIEILVRKGESPFSKIAYKNLGKNPAVRRRLQYEMGQVALTGGSQEELTKKIMQVINLTGKKGYRRAKRIAQTERNRVQSQARYETAQEAADMGIRMVCEWSARMIRTRETHAALNGKVVPMGKPFRTIAGNELYYPGDPNAPASEVVNCYCVLLTRPLLPGEEMPA